MQIRKDHIRSEILRVARARFLCSGYKGTSIRAIAEDAAVSLGSIYTYFENKDQLFRAVLQPTLDVIDHAFDEYRGSSYDLLDDKMPRQMTRFFTDLIVEHRDQLRILLSRAQGSTLESYKEALIERHTTSEREYFELLCKRHPELRVRIPHFFLHTMSSWWIDTFSELVLRELSAEELERFLGEYIEFATAGWTRMIQMHRT